MDGIHLAFRAIDSTLRGELAFCKFLSSNDTGESGGHQSGIYIPRDSAAILFDEPGVKGENKHREVKISWADGTVTDDALFNFYGAGSRNEYRITRIDRAIRSFSDDLTGALFVLVRIDNSNFNGFILDNESQINEYLSNFYCSPIQAGKLVFLHEPFEFLTLKEDPTTIPVMSLPEGFSNTEKQPDTEGDADAVLYSLLKGMGDIHIADHSWDIPDGTDVPNLHFSVTHRLINHRRHVYNSILNDSLENILKKRQIAFTKITEGNHTEYQLASTLNPSRGHNRILTMPTCRHGWSEVIKGGRAAQTFIVTFQQGMSEENFSELQDADIILVVPVNLFNMYSPKIRKNLFSLQNLIELASE